MNGSVNSNIFFHEQVLNEELFGAVAEEKDVGAITGKLFEAKQVKTYESYAILGLICSKTTLTEIIIPLKQVNYVMTLLRILNMLKENGKKGLINKERLSKGYQSSCHNV